MNPTLPPGDSGNRSGTTGRPSGRRGPLSGAGGLGSGIETAAREGQRLNCQRAPVSNAVASVVHQASFGATWAACGAITALRTACGGVGGLVTEQGWGAW